MQADQISFPSSLTFSFSHAFLLSFFEGSAAMREPVVGSAVQQLLDLMPPEMARRLSLQDADAAEEQQAIDVRSLHLAAPPAAAVHCSSKPRGHGAPPCCCVMCRQSSLTAC